MSNHGVSNLNDPDATFGITQGNPIWEEMRDIALRAGPSFLLNVSLNEQRQITRVFAGDLLAAHQPAASSSANRRCRSSTRPLTSLSPPTAATRSTRTCIRASKA